jgi:acyl dehydratase
VHPPRIDQSARRTCTVAAKDIELVTELTGDRNPLHSDALRREVLER